MTLTSPREEIARLTPELRRYARALVVGEGGEGAAETADRLVQEAIVRALRSDWRLRCANIRVWLYATLTRLHRQRPRNALSERLAGSESASENDKSSAGHAQRQDAVVQALDRLAPEDREALLLVAVERFGYDDACEILRIAKPSLIARLARARLTLEDCLAQPDGMRASAGRPPPYLRLVK